MSIAPARHRRRHMAAVLSVVAILVGACAGTSDSADRAPTPTTTPPTTTAPTTTAPAATPPTTAAPTDTAAPTTPGTVGEPVVTIEHTGGCMMIGPNCPTWTIAADGTWNARTDGEDVVDAGTVDAELVTAVTDAAAAAGNLLDEVGPGTCNGCADGIDTIATIATDDTKLVLDSTAVDFGDPDPVFAAIAALDGELVATTDIPVRSR